jgi:hypothetical protein
VHLGAAKVGHLLSERRQNGMQVLSERRLRLSLHRDREPLLVESIERSVETLDGLPLAFESEVDLAGHRSSSRGAVVDGRAEVRIARHGEAMLEQHYPWPADALLAEGQRQAAAAQSLAPGHRFTVVSFDPATQRRQAVQWEVLGREEVDIHGVPESLVAVQQRVDPDDIGLLIRAWLDPATHRTRRLRLPALGLLFDAVACDEACALAPDQHVDVLAAASVASPRALSHGERRSLLQYRLDVPIELAEVLHGLPGQRAGIDDDGLVLLTIDPAGSADAPPDANDLAATRWLQADAAELRALARRSVGRSRDPAVQMQRLERSVRRHIRHRSLRIGYASALEAYHLREGDCTEHAVLLAALARSAGIPARVATGLAYSPRLGEREHVFVPHAWVYAWVDGRWRGYDAATAGFGSAHIAMAANDGDPFRSYTGIETMGQLQIDGIGAPMQLPASRAP